MLFKTSMEYAKKMSSVLSWTHGSVRCKMQRVGITLKCRRGDGKANNLFANYKERRKLPFSIQTPYMLPVSIAAILL